MFGTWENSTVRSIEGVDKIVLSKDPGALTSFKKNAPHIENNCNRQLLSSSETLKHVETPYTLKLRLDCTLHHTRFLEFFEKFGLTHQINERIVAPCYFTIDPRMYEQLPFHVSDWYSFGPTAKLQALWSAPFLNHCDSKYYDTKCHAPHSTYFDKLYRARHSTEQYISINYARNLGYTVPSFHNDIRDEVLRDHDRFMSEEFLILTPEQFGVSCDKYHKVSKSSLQHINCFNFLDWYFLAVGQNPGFSSDPYVLKAALSRVRTKHFFMLRKKSFDRIMPVITRPLLKWTISRILRFKFGLY